MSATSSEAGGLRRAVRAAAVLATLLAALAVAGPATAQSVTVDLGEDATLTGRILQLFLMVTVLSLAPGIAMMVTCFPFMITVLAILRQGLGLQQSPPNMLMVTLALFLTWFVMEPVFMEAWDTALAPLIAGTIAPEEGFARGLAPFRVFMEGRVDPASLAELAAAVPRAEPLPADGPEGAPLSLLIPAFLLSELTRGFEVGFMIFLPFLVIDLVVASILMSMGMMMVPPVVVSLPLKLAFFVVADGWTLVAGALVRGYAG